MHGALRIRARCPMQELLLSWAKVSFLSCSCNVVTSPAASQDLVVRFLFTLGNLTATVEASRQQLLECEGCTGTLLQLYERYQRAGGATAHARGVDDVLVKLVRVLANMCIHPAVGPALAASEACVELLLETLGERRPSWTPPREICNITWSGMFTSFPFTCSKILTTSFCFQSNLSLCAAARCSSQFDTTHPLVFQLEKSTWDASLQDFLSQRTIGLLNSPLRFGGFWGRVDPGVCVNSQFLCWSGRNWSPLKVGEMQGCRGRACFGGDREEVTAVSVNRSRRQVSGGHGGAGEAVSVQFWSACDARLRPFKNGGGGQTAASTPTTICVIYDAPVSAISGNRLGLLTRLGHSGLCALPRHRTCCVGPGEPHLRYSHSLHIAQFHSHLLLMINK